MKSQSSFPTKEMSSEGMVKGLKAALHQLPPQQKQVMYLRDVERFNDEEVFYLLQVTKLQQRMLLQKARETMRNFLDEALGRPTNLSPQRGRLYDSF